MDSLSTTFRHAAKISFKVIILAVLLFWSFLLRAQTTIYSQDFSSESVGSITTSSASYPYQIESNSGCTASDVWQVSTSDADGTDCDGCTGNRAIIYYGSSGACYQDADLVLGSFTPSEISVIISFDYGYDDYDSGDQFTVTLYNKTTSTTAATLLGPLTSDCDDCSYSDEITVTPSQDYEIRVNYTANYDWGATIDNIVVQDNDAPIVLYSEPFTEDDGTVSTSQFDITCVGCDASLAEVDNNIFECKDVDGEAIFTSSVIDIEGYINLSATMDVTDVDNKMDVSDHVLIYYKLDGGAETLFPVNGELHKSFGSVVASVSSITGSTLQIIIKVDNDRGDEKVRIDNILVTGDRGLDLGATTTGVNCPGDTDGSIDLSVYSGTAPYTYVWSNGASVQDPTGLSAGTYTVTVTDDNGLWFPHTAEVSAAVSISLGVSAVDAIQGSGGELHPSITGGTAPFTYAWSNSETTESITGLSTGIYSLTVTDDNGCTIETSATVDDSYAFETITTGAVVIDMGVTPQTYENGLKPYGLVYDLAKNFNIPIKWVIDPTKSKDGIDFSHNGTDFKGGPFIIEYKHLSTQVDSVITHWEGEGVITSTLVSNVSVPVYHTISGFSNLVIDEDNEGIVTPYFSNASIPSSIYTVGLPSDLGACDDVYVLPHADPTWTDHSYLRDFNTGENGYIWSGCHAVSVLEGIFDPSNQSTRMNFLSINGLQCYGSGDCGTLVTEDHNNSPTAPYTYLSTENGDPLMQFMGDMVPASDGGSEKIYLPLSTGGWNPGAKVAVSSSDGSGNKVGAKIVYGRGFDDATNGRVVYEAGHSMTNGDEEENVAAQRVFFNFILVAGKEKGISVTPDIPESFEANVATPVSVIVNEGTPPYTYAWSVSSSGTFADATAASTTLTLSAIANKTVTCVVTDACGRESYVSVGTPQASPCVTPEIWTEDFGGYINGEEISEIWTITGSHNANSFEVENSRLEANNTGNEGVLTSEEINILNNGNVDITIDLSSSGTMEGNDYIRAYYKLDGGAETLLTNGDQTDDITGTVVASATGLNGTTLELVIRSNNNAAGEYYYADNILVQDTASCTAVASGNWTNGSIWEGCSGAGGVPNANDTVYISGRTITIDASTTISELYVNTACDGTTLNIGSTNVLNVTNDVHAYSTLNASGDIAINLSNSAIFNVGDDITLENDNTDEDIDLTVTLSNNAVMNVNGDINLPVAADDNVLVQVNDNSTIDLKGDIIRNASPSAKFGSIQFTGNSSLTLTGNAVQNITANAGSGNDDITYNNVTVNNSTPTNAFTMDGDVAVDGVLNMTQGNITTGDYAISVTTASGDALEGGRPTCYVIGTLCRAIGTDGDRYYYPVGIGGAITGYHWLRFKNNYLEGVTDICVSFDVWRELDVSNFTSYDDNFGRTFTNLTPEGMWLVEPNAQPTGGSYTAEVSTKNMTITHDLGFGLMKRDKNSGPNAWHSNKGRRPNIAEKGVRITDNLTKLMELTDFSEFGVGEGGGGALPIELVFFNAEENGNVVDLDWRAATEINNDFFTIERSLDGITFEEVLIVDGAGNSTETTDYEAVDNSPYRGTSYYRLKQTDFDGKYAYSDAVAVTIIPNAGNNDIIKIYPNPTTGNFNIDFNTNEDVIKVSIYNNVGQLAYFSESFGGASKLNVRLDQTRDFTPGLYFIQVTAGQNTYLRKLIVE